MARSAEVVKEENADLVEKGNDEEKVTLEEEATQWKIKYVAQRQAAEELKKMSKVKEAEKKRDESLANATKFTVKISSLTADITKLKDDLKLREESIKTLQTELQERKRKQSEAESQRDQAAQKLLELAGTTKNESKRLNDEIESQKKEVKKWSTSAQQSDERVTVLETQNREGQLKIENQKEEITKLSNELVGMATTIMEKDDKINELEAQLKTVEEECGARGRTLISRADQITRLQAEAEILKEAKKDLDKTLDQRASTIIEQMKKVTEANESYEKLRKDANDLVKVYRQIDSLNKTLQEEIKALKNSAKAKEEETTKQHLKEPKRIESPPPGYGEVHTVEGSFHFEAPIKTGMGRTDDHDKEKVKRKTPSRRRGTRDRTAVVIQSSKNQRTMIYQKKPSFINPTTA
ncbi:putative leucine-rich repeat-containing protein DDB_G0290503 [Paramacrobiotus metropolitanus]|uniref:putative leucine-rich repeat-containing protein DDB_G0290503 n=1 Tax=Paramacrobiotus metropolitanus TaxID=2943436 RepID=UPI0024460109|nr:putative leucine-rich repeat-containing protein DDB_G0290503 [Paramacrobiotus metropolitanus]